VLTIVRVRAHTCSDTLVQLADTNRGASRASLLESSKNEMGEDTMSQRNFFARNLGVIGGRNDDATCTKFEGLQWDGAAKP